jgi:hypothetical protein
MKLWRLEKKNRAYRRGFAWNLHTDRCNREISSRVCGEVSRYKNIVHVFINRATASVRYRNTRSSKSDSLFPIRTHLALRSTSSLYAPLPRDFLSTLECCILGRKLFHSHVADELSQCYVTLTLLQWSPPPPPPPPVTPEFLLQM